MRGLVSFVFALVLVLLALPSTCAWTCALLPGTPWRLLSVLWWVLVFQLVAVAPVQRHPFRAWCSSLLIALPVLLFAAWSTPGSWLAELTPPLGIVAVALAAGAICLLGREQRTVGALALGGWVLAAIVLQPVGLVLWPRALPFTHKPHRPAAVRRAADPPGPRPHVLLAPAVTGLEGSELTLASWEAPTPFASLADLLPYDAVVVGSAAWQADAPERRDAIRALLHFVHKGGVLLGPRTASEAWPPDLARALGPAARAEPGDALHARPLGLGKVVRGGSAEARRRFLTEAHGWVAAVETVFDRASEPPPAPAAFAPWADRPEGRTRALGILVLFALAVGAWGWLARRFRLLVLAGTALVVCAALVYAAPRPAAYRAQALRIDLGGLDGQRVEALYLRAGPRPVTINVSWPESGHIRVLGGRGDEAGRVLLGAGGRAWALRTDVPRRDPAPIPEARDGGFLLEAFLLGTPDPKRARVGRGAALSATLDGRPAPAAWTLRYE